MRKYLVNTKNTKMLSQTKLLITVLICLLIGCVCSEQESEIIRSDFTLEVHYDSYSDMPVDAGRTKYHAKLRHPSCDQVDSVTVLLGQDTLDDGPGYPMSMECINDTLVLQIGTNRRFYMVRELYQKEKSRVEDTAVTIEAFSNSGELLGQFHCSLVEYYYDNKIVNDFNQVTDTNARFKATERRRSN